MHCEVFVIWLYLPRPGQPTDTYLVPIHVHVAQCQTACGRKQEVHALLYKHRQMNSIALLWIAAHKLSDRIRNIAHRELVFHIRNQATIIITLCYTLSTFCDTVSLLYRPWTWQLSRDIPVNAGFLYDKIIVLRDTIKGTLCLSLTVIL